MLGLLGPIDWSIWHEVFCLCEVFPNPTARDLHGYEADHLSTLSSLLIIVLEMSLVLHA